MPVEVQNLGNNDERLVTNGDSYFKGMVSNARPNMLERGQVSLAVNKRVDMGQYRDRGGHFATLLLNTATDASNTPIAKPSIWGEVEYQYSTSYDVTQSDGSVTTVTTDGLQQGIVFTTNNAYIVQPGGLAVSVAYPAGVTITSRVHALQALNVVFVFRGQGLTPMFYNGGGAFQLVDQTAKTSGFAPMSNGKHACYFNNRLWVLNGDVVEISDILDPNTYDIAAYLPIERGSNDTGTALFVWNSNTIIVFKQRSIYAITGIDDTLSNIVLTMVSSSIGCNAPDSIVQSGGDIYFYSNSGQVLSVQQVFDTRLQPNPVSLAFPIQPTMDLINQPLSSQIVSAVHDNRLFISVPINGSTENNCVLVYNFTTQAWDGYDLPGSTKFNVAGWLILNFLGKNRLIGLSRSGYIFLYDYDDLDLVDVIKTDEKYPATSSLITRGYGGSQSEYYGQIYGSGHLHKFVAQGSILFVASSPNFSVYINTDGIGDQFTVASNQTFSNTTSQIWNRSDWNPTNQNNDHSSPYRYDYALYVNQDSGGVYISYNPSAGDGITPGLRQSHSLPYLATGTGNYFTLQLDNTGGNTILTNVDISVNSKEQSFEKL